MPHELKKGGGDIGEVCIGGQACVFLFEREVVMG
jgi:hypothetical protein